jgi:hypothetical protein
MIFSVYKTKASTMGSNNEHMTAAPFYGTPMVVGVDASSYQLW